MRAERDALERAADEGRREFERLLKREPTEFEKLLKRAGRPVEQAAEQAMRGVRRALPKILGPIGGVIEVAIPSELGSGELSPEERERIEALPGGPRAPIPPAPPPPAEPELAAPPARNKRPRMAPQPAAPPTPEPVVPGARGVPDDEKNNFPQRRGRSGQTRPDASTRAPKRRLSPLQKKLERALRRVPDLLAEAGEGFIDGVLDELARTDAPNNPAPSTPRVPAPSETPAPSGETAPRVPVPSPSPFPLPFPGPGLTPLTRPSVEFSPSSNDCQCSDGRRGRRKRPSNKVAEVHVYRRRMSQNSLDNLRRGKR